MISRIQHKTRWLIPSLLLLTACGGPDSNTTYSNGFSAPGFAAVNVGDSPDKVQKELGAPLERKDEKTQIRLVYAHPKDASKPYTRKEILLRDGKVAQMFDEPSADQ